MMLERYPHPDDKNQERGLTPFYLKKIQTESGIHYVSAFPIISGLLMVPVYLIPLKLGMPITWDNLAILTHVLSSMLIAYTGYLLFKFLNEDLKLDNAKSNLLTITYLFGTINFALLSQGPWQHGTVELFSLLALRALYKKSWFLTAFYLGFAILSRPTAALIVPFFGLLMVYFISKNIENRTFENFFRKINYLLNQFVMFVLGFVPPFLFFQWYTNKYYVDISNNGYSSQLLNSWLSPFPEGFLGMWLSPSKGILVYSPVILFSLIGLYLALKKWRDERNLQFIIFGAIVLVHTLVLSIWKHWYGGYGFGYRMASDVIPFMILMMVPFVESKYFDKAKNWFILLLVLSVLMEIHGLVFFDSIWHAAYDKGFRDTSWLWSIKDSELAFNIRRILVKLGYLERACPQCL